MSTASVEIVMQSGYRVELTVEPDRAWRRNTAELHTTWVPGAAYGELVAAATAVEV